MFKYRVPDEIVRRLNKMEAPTPKFRQMDIQVQLHSNQVDMLLKDAFKAGYNQAVKEMKEYFGIKGNGVHV